MRAPAECHSEPAEESQRATFCYYAQLAIRNALSLRAKRGNLDELSAAVIQSGAQRNEESGNAYNNSP